MGRIMVVENVKWGDTPLYDFQDEKERVDLPPEQEGELILRWAGDYNFLFEDPDGVYHEIYYSNRAGKIIME